MACRNCFATNFLLWIILKPRGPPCLQIKLSYSLYLLRASSFSLSVSHSLCSYCLLFFFFNVLTILALCQLWQKCQTRLSTSFINIKTKLAKFHLHSLTYIFLPDFVSLNRSLAVLKRNYAFFLHLMQVFVVAYVWVRFWSTFSTWSAPIDVFVWSGAYLLLQWYLYGICADLWQAEMTGDIERVFKIFTLHERAQGL